MSTVINIFFSRHSTSFNNAVFLTSQLKNTENQIFIEFEWPFNCLDPDQGVREGERGGEGATGGYAPAAGGLQVQSCSHEPAAGGLQVQSCSHTPAAGGLQVQSCSYAQ